MNPMTKQQIRELRAKAGLSQPAFARLLGLSDRCHSTISRWESENKLTMPDARSLQALWTLWDRYYGQQTVSDAHVVWLRS